MLWSKIASYEEAPFETEAELEAAIVDAADQLFGEKRIYIDVKKKIGAKGKTNNIPDGYLIDLSSKKEPKLYVVENELAKHDPLKHIAVQILEFSLSFETSPYLLKNILKTEIVSNATVHAKCQKYVTENNFENLDVLLEKIIYGKDRFNALVIIDSLSDELEKVLISRFQFPVEILTLQRFCTSSGDKMFQFQPFLVDIVGAGEEASLTTLQLDPSEIDTIVVPAREDGFLETFIGENRWYQIRIHPSMRPKIKHIAVYRVAPESAITHIAPVLSIEQWEDTAKYVLNFASPAQEITPIRLVPKGKVKAPQCPRYTSKARLEAASSLDEAF
ncbi:hypothetical protein LPW11_16485 [Geomonas sp. RF6]|uniref:hypothetical protein n=1 Tax=Geomonas sp. RF6 TaxID=2897342 RepID=UPI001E50E078|nr:hypothetical protein [Geomonas sp. RF6]UFS69485.1 hypothetical protein LPW11_16485 [Geomonas sp. RF6]